MARKERKYHFIYKTTNLLSGKYYIGMHSTSNENDGYLGSGKRLRYSIKKHGADNHTKEILEYCDSREELVLREIEIVNEELIADDLCMNLKVGGTGGFSSEQQAENGRRSNEKQKLLRQDAEWVRNKSEKLTLGNHKAYKNGRRVVVPDWCDKKHTQETKLKMSNQRKGTGTGETNSQYGTCWITMGGVNKKVKKEELTKWLNEGWGKGRVL